MLRHKYNEEFNMWDTWASATFTWMGNHSSISIGGFFLHVFSASHDVYVAHFHTLNPPFPSPLKIIHRVQTEMTAHHFSRILYLVVLKWDKTYKCEYTKNRPKWEHSRTTWWTISTQFSKITLWTPRTSAWQGFMVLEILLNWQR